MKKRMLLAGIACTFWLAGCSNTSDSPEANSRTAAQEIPVELLDQPFEEITSQQWESIQLSKKEFDLYLSRLAAEGAEDFQNIGSIEMRQEKIIITLDNHDGESLDNLVAAPFIDTKVRQLYVHSAYFQNRQPNIIIADLSGLVLSDVAEPLEPVSP